MDYIYFNHRGLEDSDEDNLQILLQEMSNKISICRDNNLTVGFYKEIYNIPLINFNSTFINYICSNDKYRDFCTLIIKYIDENIIYPCVNCENLYKENLDFRQWFLNVCVQDNISSFISLSNDIILNEVLYTESKKSISNYIDIDSLKNFINSKTNYYASITKVFNDIADKYSDKITILPSARSSANQISSNSKAYNNIYCAMEGLVTIILPTNNNTLTKEISDNYYKNTSFKISKESQKTANLPRCRRRRTFTIDGNSYLFLNHVKIGNDIRIHYYILDNKLYIGHCGKHLPTSTSRS